ncbi:MAG: sigma-54 dependent transcriptional regulator [Spirochaetales bacterium]|jgi:sigma-54 specific flagellar transcriptional regulator A
MKAIVYWDIDSLRIRRVLDDLDSEFEVKLATTLSELQLCAANREYSAMIVGIPLVDPDSIAAFLESLFRGAACPVFVLAGQRIPAGLKAFKASCFICPDELPTLKLKIVAAILTKSIGEKGTSNRLFIGKSKAMQKVSCLVRKYADSRHPVLILGETGTGKELVANALHSCSSRKSKPFIALNCSALPENLVESELFGTEKGAFTDAIKHNGALAKAANGTLFLDEIGNMSLSVQPKLLRALETGEYWRLGADKPERSEFRLICATCEDLESQMNRGLFRADLFYRISDLPIHVPPLRERIEDIAELADYFCLQSSKGYCSVSGDALSKLLDYGWPGNVRELKSVMNRACANVQKGSIREEDIMFMCGHVGVAKVRKKGRLT